MGQQASSLVYSGSYSLGANAQAVVPPISASRLKLPRGSHDANYPFACAAGVLGGNGSNTSQQTSAACAGRCSIDIAHSELSTTKGSGAKSLKFGALSIITTEQLPPM